LAHFQARRLPVLAESLRLLEQVAAIYEAIGGILQCEETTTVEQGSWKALEAFIPYAYARQGAPTAYASAARKTVQRLAGRRASWQETGLAQLAWQQYAEELEGRALNPRINPMCPRGTRYRIKKGEHITRQPCLIEFVQENLSNTDYNIVCWAEKMLRTGDVRSVHDLLISINGVGPKIASLFLRDIAWACDIFPTRSRELLQPVDRWVRRYVHHWEQNNRLSDPECAHWIVKQSLEAGVSPEKVNAGMWYFGARVAGDESTLLLLIDDIGAMRTVMEQHGDWLAAQADDWRVDTEGI
jgi:hypothetical protein